MTLALRVLGGREEAEEVLQDAFVRAFRGLSGFRYEAKFSTWFYRILYNLCATRVSRRRTAFVQLGQHREDEDDSDTDYFDAEAATPHELLEIRDINNILLEEVSNLPAHLREVITLFYLEQMSYEDLTLSLNQPLGTVKTRLFRARALLRRRILQRTQEKVPVS